MINAPMGTRYGIPECTICLSSMLRGTRVMATVEGTETLSCVSKPDKAWGPPLMTFNKETLDANCLVKEVN